MSRSKFDIHNLRIKETPDKSFEEQYRRSFDKKKKKTLENIANRAAKEIPEVGIILFSVLLSLSSPNDIDFVRYLTSRSVLLQRIGDISVAQRDNNILYSTRRVYVNYFIVQSQLLEKIGEREKSMETLRHGLELHPENELIIKRMEKLSKKKTILLEAVEIGKASEDRIKFLNIPSFLLPEENTTPSEKIRKGSRLTDLPIVILEHIILPHFVDIDLLKISQVCFSFRNCVVGYYERVHRNDEDINRRKFRTFIRDVYPSVKKTRNFTEYGKYVDLLLSYCFRIYSVIEEKDDPTLPRHMIDADRYSVYSRERRDTESLFEGDESVGINIPRTQEEKIIYHDILCKEAKIFYEHCNGLKKDSFNFINCKSFYQLLLRENPKNARTATSIREWRLDPFPLLLQPLPNLRSYRKVVGSTEGVRHLMKNSRECVFLDFKDGTYDGYSYNFILNNKKSHIHLEAWELQAYGIGTTSRDLGVYGSFYATLNQINRRLCIILAFVVQKIIEKGNIILKKK